ncbi:lipoyl synthase [Eikenella sp. NML080894]|uniref:Lipoyl synthase n=1 Tax=Eikenella exigua TaxID=2528037 RepID=A0AAX1F7X3_9NEIS|nr:MULTISPECIES: lipoyl synthase [Eikenella]OAM28644.1 lipoyl synthase [Eikenella sp. NML01-A-086]OAM30248.1 lipoyl synthase [Eikenella sp. NML03-A-027]OAM36659.1 lipoyl synthase [Eikenella sp. NML080894]OAM39741.1 lipoyl synthase [Eikenella sp. NML120348]OAM41228.1 lipoyl synthase [Eikenella sp. NML97-A-109]
MATENPAKQDNSRGVKHKGAAKVARIPIKVVPLEQKLKKPEWIRAQLPTGKKFFEIKNILRDQKMHTVCEEASCPNIGECFSRGTATFMIMGDICTRRCPFCDVGHGRPNALDTEEPQHLASSVAAMNLRYVVITSVDRDDLRDGGAQHFADCITAIRERSPNTKIEILVPDFRGRMDIALEILAKTPPDVMNHNLETHPRLYKQARPGANYQHSLELLRRYKEMMPHIPTKSGIMVGLGETDDEVREIMRDMRANNIEMITVGQYLQPSNSHLPVLRYVTPEMFKQFEHEAYAIGFTNAAIGAMVRSSYHADAQAAEAMASAGGGGCHHGH